MKVSKRFGMQSVITLAVLVVLFLTAPVSVGAEAKQAVGALTSPPPQESSTYLMSGNQYLYSGNLYIENNGSLSVKCTGEAIASQKVESIGIIFTIQRWTGTSWVEGTSANVSDAAVSKLKAYANFDVKSGYYYRAKAVLWVSQGGLYEQSTIYSSSVLSN